MPQARYVGFPRAYVEIEIVLPVSLFVDTLRSCFWLP
jgi:hypothetical protein